MYRLAMNALTVRAVDTRTAPRSAVSLSTANIRRQSLGMDVLPAKALAVLIVLRSISSAFDGGSES